MWNACLSRSLRWFSAQIGTTTKPHAFSHILEESYLHLESPEFSFNARLLHIGLGKPVSFDWLYLIKESAAFLIEKKKCGLAIFRNSFQSEEKISTFACWVLCLSHQLCLVCRLEMINEVDNEGRKVYEVLVLGCSVLAVLQSRIS